MEEGHGSSRADRKTVEKKRRMHMKYLITELNSLIPNETPQEVTLLPDQLQNAANYIKTLQEKIEQMKETKEHLVGIKGTNDSTNVGMTTCWQLPYVEVQDLGPALMVILISRLDTQTIFYKSIRVLEEEGAEVVNAGFSIVGDKIFHTIHATVPDPRVGFDAEIISERLKNLVQENT